MKTSEIRDRIKSMGFERGITYCLEALNEEHQQTRRDIAELASYFDKMVDSFGNVVTMAETMKQVLEKGAQAEEDLGPNTYALGEDE